MDKDKKCGYISMDETNDPIPCNKLAEWKIEAMDWYFEALSCQEHIPFFLGIGMQYKITKIFAVTFFKKSDECTEN